MFLIMGSNSYTVPILSQAVSLLQIFSGDSEGALKTQMEFSSGAKFIAKSDYILGPSSFVSMVEIACGPNHEICSGVDGPAWDDGQPYLREEIRMDQKVNSTYQHRNYVNNNWAGLHGGFGENIDPILQNLLASDPETLFNDQGAEIIGMKNRTITTPTDLVSTVYLICLFAKLISSGKPSSKPFYEAAHSQMYPSDNWIDAEVKLLQKFSDLDHFRTFTPKAESQFEDIYEGLMFGTRHLVMGTVLGHNLQSYACKDYFDKDLLDCLTMLQMAADRLKNIFNHIDIQKSRSKRASQNSCPLTFPTPDDFAKNMKLDDDYFNQLKSKGVTETQIAYLDLTKSDLRKLKLTETDLKNIEKDVDVIKKGRPDKLMPDFTKDARNSHVVDEATFKNLQEQKFIMEEKPFRLKFKRVTQDEVNTIISETSMVKVRTDAKFIRKGTNNNGDPIYFFESSEIPILRFDWSNNVRKLTDGKGRIEFTFTPPNRQINHLDKSRITSKNPKTFDVPEHPTTPPAPPA